MQNSMRGMTALAPKGGERTTHEYLHASMEEWTRNISLLGGRELEGWGTEVRWRLHGTSFILLKFWTTLSLSPSLFTPAMALIQATNNVHVTSSSGQISVSILSDITGTFDTRCSPLPLEAISSFVRFHRIPLTLPGKLLRFPADPPYSKLLNVCILCSWLSSSLLYTIF